MRIWALVVADVESPANAFMYRPNQTFRRYSQRKVLDYVWQLRLISERNLIFAAFLYDRTFIDMGIEKTTN